MASLCADAIQRKVEGCKDQGTEGEGDISMFLPHSRSHFASLAKREGKWKKENPVTNLFELLLAFLWWKGKGEPPAKRIEGIPGPRGLF